MTKPSSEGKVRLPYESIRNLTSPEEKENGTRTFFANVSANEIRRFDTAGNLRDYIPAHPGKKRNSVHRSIYETVESNADHFITLNSGITLACKE